MKIIDAHMHFCNYSGFFELAKAAGHENTAEHLLGQYEKYGIVGGVVMGNKTLEPNEHNYPKPLRYCIGLDTMCYSGHDIAGQAELVEKNLQRRDCVGIKLYPGYNHFYVYDDSLTPFYKLAEKYNKPVAIHTGATALSNALLKYSHPLTLDEAAVKWPQVQFVMCHFGNPWLNDAAAVLSKNKNVAADLSGLLEGKIPDMTELFIKKDGYISALETWLEYLDSYERIMFGTDWPLANLGDYIEFTKAIIPESEWEKVFWQSANRIYGFSME